MFAVHMVSLDVFLGFVLIVVGLGVYFMRKFLNDNPDVKDVAKKAVAAKAIEIIGRLIRK